MFLRLWENDSNVSDFPLLHLIALRYVSSCFSLQFISRPFFSLALGFVHGLGGSLSQVTVVVLSSLFQLSNMLPGLLQA